MNSDPNENQVADLIARHLNGDLNESEMEQLAELLDSDPSVRKKLVEQSLFEARMADVLRGDIEFQQAEKDAKVRNRKTISGVTVIKTLLAIAALALVAVSIQQLIQPPKTIQLDEPKIARITGLSGPLQWTGNGGRVFSDLAVGTELSGGTIDGLAPESWFELEFNDGSKIVISGNSMLTYSDLGQKELHLKGGSFSASVNPQPVDKPMLIYTRSAVLEVLGTEFEVEAELASTFLNVSEGKVRIKRLSDGDSIDVPAKHRIIAAADRELVLQRVPDSVDQWTSQLDRGPHGLYGKWSPRVEEENARLESIPYTTELGKTIYAAAMSVSNGNNPPVVIRKGSKLRVHGTIESPSAIWFGITLRQPNGDFAGRFQIIRSKTEFPAGHAFEVTLDLENCELDPSLKHLRSKLPAEPFDLTVGDVWCHTLYDQAGLAITEVELVAPDN